MSEGMQSETAKLQKAELVRLIEFSPAVHYIARASGDYGATYISPGINAQLGYEPAQFTQDSGFWTNHIHPDDRSQVIADLQAIFENDWHTHEYRFQHADGSYRWMHDQSALVRDKDGDPLEIIGSWLDITECKEAEEALADHRRRTEKEEVYRAMLSATHHILGNFLQKTVWFRSELEDSRDVNEETLKLYDQTIEETAAQIRNLDNIQELNKTNIEDRYLPK